MISAIDAVVIIIIGYLGMTAIDAVERRSEC